MRIKITTFHGKFWVPYGGERIPFDYLDIAILAANKLICRVIEAQMNAYTMSGIQLQA